MERLKSDPLVINRIRANYIFSEMTDAELQQCLTHLDVTAYAPGEIIFQQGAQASRFFIVCEGVVQLFRTSPMGDKKVIDIVKAGDSFAEAVFFMGGNYPVHAMAVDHVKLAGIAFQDFNACLANNVGLAFRMMGGMSRRIHALVNEIDRLTLGTACQRLAYFAGTGAGGKRRQGIDGPARCPQACHRLAHRHQAGNAVAHPFTLQGGRHRRGIGPSADRARREETACLPGGRLQGG